MNQNKIHPLLLLFLIVVTVLTVGLMVNDAYWQAPVPEMLHNAP